jgi:hypothetical protein
MPTPIIGNVLDWQDAVHGAFELTDVTNISFSDGDSGETVFNVRQEPIGAKQAKGSSTVTLTQQKTVENAKLPNWRELKRRQLTCLLTITEIGADNAEGARRALSVKVAKVDDSTDNQGEATREVELTIVQENEQ